MVGACGYGVKSIVPLCALVTLWTLLLLVHAVVADKALRLKVSPATSFEPAKLAIQVRVQPTIDDRWITVAMDNGDYRRVSGFTIEGDRMFYTVDWRDVPAGEYDVVAAIGHGSVTRASERASVIVVARGP